MLPVLLQIGSFKLYSYGVFLFVALFVGLYWWWKLGRDEHLEEVSLFDTYFVSLFAGFVVGRITYVLLHLDDFTNIYRVLGITAFPGISLVGTIVGVCLTVFLISRYQEWEIWKVFDNIAVTFAIVVLIGSVGSLLSGSIIGIPVSWGIHYPLVSEPRFPLDFVVLVWAIVNFVIVSRVRKSFRFYDWYKNGRTVAPDGLTSYVALLSLSFLYIVRGMLEDTWRVFVFGYYTIFGVMIFLVCCYLIYTKAGYKLFAKNKEK